MATQAPIQLTFAKTGLPAIDKNFTEVSRAFEEGCPILSGALTGDIVLVVGANLIKPPGKVKVPRGRIVVYQSAGSDFSDGTTLDNGHWVLHSSAACTVRILFF